MDATRFQLQYISKHTGIPINWLESCNLEYKNNDDLNKSAYHIYEAYSFQDSNKLVRARRILSKLIYPIAVKSMGDNSEKAKKIFENMAEQDSEFPDVLLARINNEINTKPPTDAKEIIEKGGIEDGSIIVDDGIENLKNYQDDEQEETLEELKERVRSISGEPEPTQRYDDSTGISVPDNPIIGVCFPSDQGTEKIKKFMNFLANKDKLLY